LVINCDPAAGGFAGEWEVQRGTRNHLHPFIF
jgi:hypothetical protein